MIHSRLETLIDEMLEGHILLDEAIGEFEKLYIKKALARHKQHLSKTAVVASTETRSPNASPPTKSRTATAIAPTSAPPVDNLRLTALSLALKLIEC